MCRPRANALARGIQARVTARETEVGNKLSEGSRSEGVHNSEVSMRCLDTSKTKINEGMAMLSL